MSGKHKFFGKDDCYFVTITVFNWIKIFTRENYRMVIIESLRFCQLNKGLEIYGYCLMTNHLHLIVRAAGKYTLSEILRDFKKFTAKVILHKIKEDAEMYNHPKFRKKIDPHHLWQEGVYPIILYNPKLFYQKLNYIHKNPVKAKMVENPEEYLYSSARNYAGLNSILDIYFEIPELKIK